MESICSTLGMLAYIWPENLGTNGIGATTLMLNVLAKTFAFLRIYIPRFNSLLFGKMIEDINTFILYKCPFLPKRGFASFLRLLRLSSNTSRKKGNVLQ